MALGAALSGGLRWGKRHRRSRPVFLALGLNGAALAFLGAVLTAGLEPGGLGVGWPGWIVPGAVGLILGLPAFRFPLSVGLPVLFLAGAAALLVTQALDGFRPLGPVFEAPEVQPLTDRETVTAFALRMDFLEVPESLPLAPSTLYRIRSSSSEPAEWWWSWAASRGWARSAGAALPTNPLKFGIYKLVLTEGRPTWSLVVPELDVPESP